MLTRILNIITLVTMLVIIIISQHIQNTGIFNT